MSKSYVDECCGFCKTCLTDGCYILISKVVLCKDTGSRYNKPREGKLRIRSFHASGNRVAFCDNNCLSGYLKE